MSLSLVERIRSEMAGVNRWNADTRGTLLFECLEAFAARAEGDPAAEGDIPSIIERGQTGERLSPTEQSAWTGYELGWKDGLKHAISDLGECFECGHDLNGPYCPACNSDIDAARAEGVAALQQAAEQIAENAHCSWRPEVRAFADLMEAQLRANDHKPGWKDDADLDLFERLGEESTELLAALHRNAKRLMWGDSWVMEDTVPRVGLEAADVANFAMMIADVCGALALPQQTALVEEGVEKIIAQHEPAACGASAPSEAPRSDGDEG